MKNTGIEGDFGFFSSCLYGEVLHIRFKGDLLKHLVGLSKRDMIADFGKRIAESGKIKVILLASDFHKIDGEAYTRFFLERYPAKRIDIHKLHNITSQLIMGIIGLDCMVIHACTGDIISLFLNISLACDYRIASDNTVFCNPYLDMGLIPVGGGPYFLSKMMGTGKALETLLLNKTIDVQKALKLGLVDSVLPSLNFNDAALDIARRFADQPSWTIAGLKKLVNFSKKDLNAYFETEKKELFKIIGSNKFSKQINRRQKQQS